MGAWAKGDIVWKAAAGSTIKTTLIDTADYTVDLVNHDFYDDIAAAAKEETSGAMTLVDGATNGVVDASDVTFTATTGDTCEGIVLWKDTGVAATSNLLLWWDTSAGLPVTLGGDVTVQWGNVAGTLLARI